MTLGVMGIFEAFGPFDWGAQIFFFGLIALGLFLASVYCIRKGKYIAALVLAVAELVSGALTIPAWMWALKISGKVDWYLLGLRNYPPVALIFYAMFAVGILCIVFSIVGLIKAGKHE